MKTESISLSGSCKFTLTTYENIDHKDVCLEYTEHATDHWNSDSETSIYLDAEKAREIIALLHKAFPALAATPPAQPAPVREPAKRVCGLGCKDLGACCADPRCEAVATTPPAAQRQWVGLTPQEVHAIWSAVNPDWHTPRGAVSAIYEHIEAKLKEKNT